MEDELTPFEEELRRIEGICDRHELLSDDKLEWRSFYENVAKEAFEMMMEQEYALRQSEDVYGRLLELIKRSPCEP